MSQAVFTVHVWNVEINHLSVEQHLKSYQNITWGQGIWETPQILKIVAINNSNELSFGELIVELQQRFISEIEQIDYAPTTFYIGN